MEQTEKTAPVTVKAMSVETWQRAIAAKDKRGETIGEWLKRAIERQVAIEAGDRVEFPGETMEQTVAVSRVVIPPSELTELMRAAAAVSDASGEKLPKVTANHLFILLRDLARSARGLPPLKPRTRPRKALTGPLPAGSGVVLEAATSRPEPIAASSP